MWHPLALYVQRSDEMPTPITLAQLSRTSQNQITVAFQNSIPVQGFDHAMVLLVEQDGAKDTWEVATQTANVGGFTHPVLDFANSNFPGGINTSGPEDDVGGTGPRRRLRIVATNAGWTTTTFTVAPWQPDTDPGNDLEFYAVLLIVSVAAGSAVASLGDIVVTPTLSGAF